METLRPEDPARLGPYRLVGLLGSGGMGQVYLGRDDRTGRAAAVKVLRAELADDTGMAQRFLREAESAASVRSAGVARVLGSGTEAGRQWIATEFLAGPTLDRAVERYGPLGATPVRALTAALARTLRDIHAAGLVHRDLKPANIVLTSQGPRVIDFGIARPEHGLTLTATGQTPATPGYAPPEQVLGRRTGPAGDMFSLGAVLAFASSGQRAYDGGHVAAVQYQVVHGEPELGAVPLEFRELARSCLAGDPAERPGPAQVARTLAAPRRDRRVWGTGPLAEDIAEREHTAARRLAAAPPSVEPHSAGPVPEGPTRRRVAAALAGGGTLVAAGGGGLAWWLLRGRGTEGGDGGDGDAPSGQRPWDAEPLADYTEGTAPQPLWGPLDVAAAGAPAPLPVRDMVVVAAAGGGLAAYGVRDGKRRWRRSDADPATRVLAPAQGLVLTADGEGALVALGTRDGTPEWTAARADAAVLLAADRTAVYLLTRQGELRAVGLKSRRALWTVRTPVRASPENPAAAAVAEGRLVLCGSDGKVAALDTADGRRAWGPREGGPDVLAPALADGTAFLGGRELTAIGLTDGREKWSQAAASEKGWGAPSLSPASGGGSDGSSAGGSADGSDGTGGDGRTLYAVDGTELYARAASDGGDVWTLSLNFEDLPRDAPVVQGNSAWAVADTSGDAGVAAADTRIGKTAWVYTQQGDGRARMAGAGNRIFLTQAGQLTAMPVC
ncbi:serine/threonine-protein kinase [Streptomyces sp. N2-109]|uniref:Serine/threonine-protein kinase n=1 Tax=Streptomyces gossypii TaxID=2883101 RepID=A0ABT2JVM4_9ACTN|nr:serine/threonine-protein kinase [Streptomyces gossypii]MCT2591791.1 serine/threonine-protein kinase [Streptomyces gossypii]